MIFSWFRGRRADPDADRIYAMIVAQSRQPAFYTDYGVEDTMGGRYDLLILHAFLVLRRLSAAEVGLGSLGQSVCDILFRELDRALRESGVGDLSVPKRIKKMAKAFYGRVEVYGLALQDGDMDALAAAIERNVYGTDGPPREGACRLARYAKEAVALLDGQDAGMLRREGPCFPYPAVVV